MPEFHALCCDRCHDTDVFGYRSYNYQDKPRAFCKRCWYLIEEDRQYDAAPVFDVINKNTIKVARLALPLCPYCGGDSLYIADVARHPSGNWDFYNHNSAYIWAICHQCDIDEPILLIPPPPLCDRDMFRCS